MEVNLVDGYAVHRGLGGSQAFENGDAVFLYRCGKIALPKQLFDFGQPAVPVGGRVGKDLHVGAGQPMADNLFRLQAIAGQLEAGEQLLQLPQLQAAVY